MKREATTKLIEWKNSPKRKPLLVRGARQVGKSYTITEFGREHFTGEVHILNFERNPEYGAVFKQNLDTNRIIPELEILLNKKIVAETDLLFFDEIQECPNAIMALRYFYEQKPELHVIAAGSLIEFALQDISFPVGRIQMLRMHPMTFTEFLDANNNALLAEKIRQKERINSDVIIDRINQELYKYFIVGGMPECVKTFVENQNYIDVSEIQHDLLITFRQDFSKYAGHSDKRCLNSVLNTVANKVGEQIKYSQLSADFSIPTIKKAFELMELAGLYTRVYSTSPSGMPLGVSISEKSFKTVFLDIGLFSNINKLQFTPPFDKANMTAQFNGKLAEQFVGQELRAKNTDNLYYWSRAARGSSAEVDYLIQQENKIIPIEVKSGSSGRLRSLHMLLQQFENIEKAYVFTDSKYGELEDQKLIFKPLFEISGI